MFLGKIPVDEIEHQTKEVNDIPPELLLLMRIALLRGRLTVRQIASFLKKAIAGLGEEVEEPVENLATVKQVIEILGETAVVSARRAAAAWEVEDVLDPQFVGYGVDELREAAEANKLGHRFRLIYINGVSLSEIVDIRLEHPPHVPRRESLVEWLEQLPGMMSASAQPSAGYYLIDFAADRFAKQNFAEQAAKISEMGAEFERPADAVMLEAAFTMVMVGGEQPFATADHWGQQSWEGMKIVFGPSGSGGIDIGFHNPLARHGRNRRPLGACMVRLPRHLLRAKLSAR